MGRPTKLVGLFARAVAVRLTTTLTKLTTFATLAGFACACIAPAANAGAGKDLYDEFVAENQLYPDERWQQYVRDIGARLLAHTPDHGKKYHFYVLDGNQVNAFATGDAYIFVSRGLLAFLNSEDQLAAVIGHEIGHVVGRHSRKRRTSEIAGKSLGMVAAFVTGRGELYRDVANPLTALITSGYGREMELEADHLGGEFMARAGYDPQAIIETVWVLKDQQVFSKQVAGKVPTYHGLFASHPRNDQRLHSAVAYARTLSSQSYAEPSGDFWELMDGLAFGDEAATGLVDDETYYHSGLRVVIEFPEGWQVVAPKTQVIARAPGGKEEGSITVARHEFVKRKSPKEYVTDVLRRDDVMNGEELEINGAEAFIGEVDVGESDAQLQLLAVLYRRQDVFLFKAECGPEGDPAELREQFRQTLERLRQMSAEDLAVANGRRIEVIEAEPGQTYARLAERSSLASFPEDTLRLMNADYPHGEPTAGDYVKVVK